jgi:hypothetical protein
VAEVKRLKFAERLGKVQRLRRMQQVSERASVSRYPPCTNTHCICLVYLTGRGGWDFSRQYTELLKQEDYDAKVHRHPSLSDTPFCPWIATVIQG